MVWLGPLEPLKMTSDANEEHTVDLRTVGKINMTGTHDTRTLVADIKVAAVQTNVTEILRSTSDNTRWE
jgi:hypothetical protein